jgi:VIT1/CCC1 family predicted Fe2+/Mn2+ transporter
MAEHVEPHTADSGHKLNWLRAAVLGANDGIISVASIIAGIAGATSDLRTILIGGAAGLMAGAFSMAAGEYVSVSTQRDTEMALLEKERKELRDFPEAELEEITTIYKGKGLSDATARTVARELTAHDALAAHAEVELRIHPEELTSPSHAAIASFFSFLIGGIIPVIAIVIPPDNVRVTATFLAVLIALVVTGILSAWASGGSYRKVVMRVVLWGALAMAVTYGLGRLLGISGL